MTIVLEHEDAVWTRQAGMRCNGGKMEIGLTVEQARALRDQITKHLRGASRDVPPKPEGETE